MPCARLPRRQRTLLLLVALLASLRGADARRLLASASPALGAAAGTAAAPPAPSLLSAVHNRKAPVLATMPTATYVAPTATPVAPQLVSRIASAVLGAGLLAAIVAAVLAVANANAPPRGVAAPGGGYRGEAASRELFAPGGAAAERARLLR